MACPCLADGSEPKHGKCSARSPEQKYLCGAQLKQSLNALAELLFRSWLLSARSNVMCGEWSHVSQVYNFEDSFGCGTDLCLDRFKCIAECH